MDSGMNRSRHIRLIRATGTTSIGANSPRWYLKYPVTAIIAALSVVNLNSGRNVFQPRRTPSSTIARRRPELAETPPAIAMSRMS